MSMSDWPIAESVTIESTPRDSSSIEVTDQRVLPDGTVQMSVTVTAKNSITVKH